MSGLPGRSSPTDQRQRLRPQARSDAADARPSRPRLGLSQVAVLLALAASAARRLRPGRGGSLDSVRCAVGAGLTVVATTTVFADIVRNVGGDRVTVSSIIPAGAGPEDYEPKPEDARKLLGADLIVSNGVGLDDFLDKLVDAAGEGAATRLVLGDGSRRSSSTASRTPISGSTRAS